MTARDYRSEVDQIKGCMKTFAEGHPGAMEGFGQLHQGTVGPGVLDAKTPPPLPGDWRH